MLLPAPLPVSLPVLTCGFDFRFLERWERQLLRRFQLQLSEDQTVDSKVQQLQEKLETKVIELQKEIRQELGKF